MKVHNFDASLPIRENTFVKYSKLFTFSVKNITVDSSLILKSIYNNFKGTVRAVRNWDLDVEGENKLAIEVAMINFFTSKEVESVDYNFYFEELLQLQEETDTDKNDLFFSKYQIDYNLEKKYFLANLNKVHIVIDDSIYFSRKEPSKNSPMISRFINDYSQNIQKVRV